MRRIALGTALAAGLLTGGCIVPIVGPDDDAGLTPEQSRAELLSRPDVETATAALEVMLDQIQTALTADAGLPATWEPSRNKGSRTACAGFTGLGGQSRSTAGRILRAQIPDELRDTVVATVERVTSEYGFSGTRTFNPAPGRHDMIQFGPDEASFSFGWELNATMRATTGCHRVTTPPDGG